MNDAPAFSQDQGVLLGQLLLPQTVDLARRGRYAEAERQLQSLLAHSPSADGYCLLGKIYGQQARYSEAAIAFEKALALQPTHFEASAALHTVKALARPVPASDLRRWKFATTASLVLSLAVAVLALRHTASVEPISRPALTNPDALVQVNTAKMMESFAAIVAAIQPLRPYTDLSLQPVVSGNHTVVNVRGTVPSVPVQKRLRQVLDKHAGPLEIDMSAVAVTHSYVIHKHDTLNSIAATLCGHAALATVLEAVNRAAVANKLRLGASIVVPCE